MMTVPQQHQQQRRPPPEHQTFHRKNLSHVKSEEAFTMNARFEQSKGVMSPSPDMRGVPPHMYSNKKRSGTNQHYYSNYKSANVIEQMSG